MLAVGDGRIGCEPMITVMAFVRKFFAKGFPPKDRAGVAIEANYLEAHHLGRLLRAHATTAGALGLTPARTGPAVGRLRKRTSGGTAGLGFGCRRVKFFASRNGCVQKDLILPNNRRGSAAAWYFHFPLHVFDFAPFDGRIAIGRNAIVKRPAPGRPILVTRRARNQRQQTNRGSQHHTAYR